MTPNTLMAWITLPLLAVSTGTLAQHMNSTAAPCRGKVATSAMTECFADAGKMADAQLNQLYAKIMRILRPNEQQALRKAERLWVEFRNAACSSERGLYDGGTAAGPAYLACVEEETRMRVSDLQTTYGWVVEKFGNVK